MNSEKSKTSEPYKLLLNLADKISVNRSDKYAALPNLIMYHTCKNIKKSYKRNRLEISSPTWNENFSYLMDHILYQIFNNILNMSKKNMENWLIILQ